MLHGFLRRLSSDRIANDSVSTSNDYSSANGHANPQSSSMRARAGSIRLPLYSDSPKMRGQRDISPDSPSYRSAKPHMYRGRKYSRWRAWLTSYRFPEDYSLLQLLKFFFIALFLFIMCILWIWEVQIEVFFYSRNWVDREVLALEPLAGCFDPDRISSQYNMTKSRQPKLHEVQAGLPLRMGMDCYDLAATIPSHPLPPSDAPFEKTIYHTYWRSDLAPFEERQEWLVKSFFATQDLSRSTLILWSNGDLRGNPYIMPWLARYPDAFQLQVVDVDQLAVGTALEGSSYLHQRDSKAWIDGDLLRLLVVWAYGGVWVDMDSLLTRDLHSLLEHEFFTQWDCYDKAYRAFNGALLHFEQHSPYLCEAFHIMATSKPPKPGSLDWGSLLYLKLWRRLVAGGVPPFKVLPFCFSDARSCRLDNRLPDPFAKDPKGARWPLRGPRLPSLNNFKDMDIGGALDIALGKVFSVHLHNQWEKRFPAGGWVERLLLTRYNRILGTSGDNSLNSPL